MVGIGNRIPPSGATSTPSVSSNPVKQGSTEEAKKPAAWVSGGGESKAQVRGTAQQPTGSKVEQGLASLTSTLSATPASAKPTVPVDAKTTAAAAKEAQAQGLTGTQQELLASIADPSQRKLLELQAKVQQQRDMALPSWVNAAIQFFDSARAMGPEVLRNMR